MEAQHTLNPGNVERALHELQVIVFAPHLPRTRTLIRYVCVACRAMHQAQYTSSEVSFLP